MGPAGTTNGPGSALADPIACSPNRRASRSMHTKGSKGKAAAAAQFEPDIVIVGSGAAGGMAAYALTRAGVKVRILEAGRDYDPVAESAMFKWNHEALLHDSTTTDKHFGFYDATANGGWEVPG